MYCILDWGLGHASRSIPIIHYLKKSGHTIIIASSRDVNTFLKKEFQHFEFIDLPPYQPHYSERALLFGLLSQAAHFRKTILSENKIIQSFVASRGIKLIISDNRFGCFSKRATSVYITHQITFKLKGLFRPFSFIPKLIHASIIRRYSYCWIPDDAALSLSGALGRGRKNSEFIGPLSQFYQEKHTVQKKNLLIILSGPEPHRTRLEQQLIKDLHDFDYPVVLVRGVQNKPLPEKPKTWTVHDLSSGQALETLMDEASQVICRSGYSSIMDLVKKQKRALLIPTPGQPEQEFLAHYVASKRWFNQCVQKDFSLTQINWTNTSHSPPSDINFSAFKKSIDRVLQSVS